MVMFNLLYQVHTPVKGQHVPSFLEIISIHGTCAQMCICVFVLCSMGIEAVTNNINVVWLAEIIS